MTRLFWPILIAIQIAAPKPPTISVELREKFFRAQSEVLQANEQAEAATRNAQQKQTAFQLAVRDLEGACGGKYQPTMKDGEPTCEPKVDATSAKDGVKK